MKLGAYLQAGWQLTNCMCAACIETLCTHCAWVLDAIHLTLAGEHLLVSRVRAEWPLNCMQCK